MFLKVYCTNIIKPTNQQSNNQTFQLFLNHFFTQNPQSKIFGIIPKLRISFQQLKYIPFLSNHLHYSLKNRAKTKKLIGVISLIGVIPKNKIGVIPLIGVIKK